MHTQGEKPTPTTEHLRSSGDIPIHTQETLLPSRTIGKENGPIQPYKMNVSLTESNISPT